MEPLSPLFGVSIGGRSWISIATLLSLCAHLVAAQVFGSRQVGRDLSMALEPEAPRKFWKTLKPCARMPTIAEEKTVNFRKVPSNPRERLTIESYSITLHKSVLSQFTDDEDIKDEFIEWVLGSSLSNGARLPPERPKLSRVYYQSDLVVAGYIFFRDRYPELLTEYANKADIPQLVEEYTAKRELPEITLESFLSNVFGAYDDQEAVNFVDWLKIGFNRSPLEYDHYYKLQRLYEYYMKFILESQFSRLLEFGGYPKKNEHITLMNKPGGTDLKAKMLLEQHIYPLVSEERHSLVDPSIELKHFKEILKKEGGHPFHEIQLFHAWLKLKHPHSVLIYDNNSYNQRHLFQNYVQWIDEVPELSKTWCSNEYEQRNHTGFSVLDQIHMDGVKETAQKLFLLKKMPNKKLKELINEMEVPPEDKRAMKIYYLIVIKNNNEWEAPGIPWTTRKVNEMYFGLREHDNL